MRRLAEYFLYANETVPASKLGQGGQRLTYFHCVGFLVNSKALWIGAHYSEHHKRWCINILPCLTVWWTKPGGYLP